MLSTLAVLTLITFSGVAAFPSPIAHDLHHPAVANALVFPLTNSASSSTSSTLTNLTTLTSSVPAVTTSTSSATSSTSSTNSTHSSATTVLTASYATRTGGTNQSTTITTTSLSSITGTHSTVTNASATSNATRTTTTFSGNQSTVTTEPVSTNASSTMTSSHTATTSTNATSQATTSSGSSVSTKWNPYDDFYNFLNYGLFKDGGDCYGFSTTAVLYFRHYALDDMTYPYFPEPATSVAAIPGQTGKWCLPFIGCLTSSDTLSQSTFPIYVHQTYSQIQVSGSTDPHGQIQLLESSIQQGIPVVMLLGMGTPEGHAVVAWGYSQFPNGNLIISISDPNLGNVPAYAYYYPGGEFSYTSKAEGSSYTWTTFLVSSPQILQWAWLAPSQLSSTVEMTNQFYVSVFSDVPITILGKGSTVTTTAGTAASTGTNKTTTTTSTAVATSVTAGYVGQASFGTPGDSLTFNNTIAGVVGFEEGGIQVYGIPQGVPFTIEDPGETSLRIMVIIPQNSTSVVGYQLSSASSTPLSLNIAPENDKLDVATSSSITLSVAFFSAGQHGYSVLNATSIPIASSQTAAFSVPDWNMLNSTQSAVNLQTSQPSGGATASYTITNGQQGLPATASAGLPMWLAYSAIVVVAAVIVAAVLTWRRRL